MQFLDRFTLYDVFLVALGLVTASIIRIFYDSYQEKKRLKKLGKIVDAYNESMDDYIEGIVIVSGKHEIIFANKEAYKLFRAQPKSFSYDYLKKNVKLQLNKQSKKIDMFTMLEKQSRLSQAEMAIQGYTLPVTISINNFSLSTNIEDHWEIIVVRDITNEIKLRKQLDVIKTKKDYLTGLSSREHLHTELFSMILQASRENNKMAMALLSITNFDTLLVRYGIRKIELLIKSIASSLSEAVTSGDKLYRFDDKGFVIIFNQHDENVVEKQVSFYKEVMEKQLRDESILGKISDAIYYFSTPYPTVDQAMNKLLTLQYSEKSTNLDILDIEDDDQYVLKETQFKLEKKDFEEAIKNKDFFFFYQPIYELKKNKLIGVEVLTRLHYKKEGILYPNQFLKDAIECKMMTEVTMHLLDHVLLQKRFWSTQLEEDITMTINLGVDDIRSGIFSETLEKKALEYQVDLSQVIIDIPCNIFHTDFEAVFEECYMLKKIGVKIAVDHFAKGDLNLQHLSMVPVHAIKIDGSIVSDIVENEEKLRLVAGIISLGRKLDVEVGASFVDSQEIQVLLQHLGCHFAQGNFLGEPMPAFEINNIIEERF